MTNEEWRARLKSLEAPPPPPLVIRPWWENPEPRFGEFNDREDWIPSKKRGL